MNSITLRVPIYGVILKVTVGDQSLDAGVEGCLMVVGGGVYWIRIRDTKKGKRVLSYHNTVAHEVFHAVFHILDDAGLKLTRESEDAFAYLQGYITEQIYKRL